ncbi:MAG: hypothetical protein GOV01_00770 [Candidatus Altiarchaeota archaeon]|nr:hypothetical protein [Candidatus Altiarchaeota archaeon]
MRIGFASDLHLGFGSGRRKGDACIQAKRAMEKLLSEDVDVIVLPGDVFDTPVPRPEVLRDAAYVFQMAAKKTSDLKLTGVGRDSPETKGIPIIAIHGNHDRRVKGDVNPMQLMDIMGYIVYLHKTGVLADDTGFFGVGAVPESYSKKLFRDMSAKPFGDRSFFLFHQDTVPQIPHASLKWSDLPQGFTYYVNGHIHAPLLQKNHLVVGSTVVTQMKPEENEKYVWVWDQGFEKHLIQSRPLHYLQVDANGRAPSEILVEIDDALQKVLTEKYDETPMVRIKVTGKLKEGFKSSNFIFQNNHNLIVSFQKQLEGSAISEVDLKGMNVDELAVGVLKKMLGERGLKMDASKLYTYLLNGDESAVWKLLGDST